MMRRLALSCLVVISATASAIPQRGERPARAGGFAEPVRYYVTADAPGTHVTTPGVPAFGVDVDGVGKVINWTKWWQGSCALISDRHVLTAAHMAYPGENLTVSFDLPGGTISIGVAHFIPHPLYLDENISATSMDTGFDVAVIELQSDAPPAVPRYPIYTGHAETGTPAVMVGYGATGDGWTGATFSDGAKRAGLNLYDATGEDTMALFGGWPLQPGAYVAYDFDSGLPANDAFGYVGLPELGYGPDEVKSAPGDSGGPTFIQEGSQWKVAGIASWGIGFPGLPDAYPFTNSSFGELSFDTRITTHADFIESALTGTPLDGGFKGPLDPASWIFYDDAGGNTDFSWAPYRARLSGGNSGGGGLTSITAVAPCDGFVSFDWNYGTQDLPGYDAFGFFHATDVHTLTSGWSVFGSDTFDVTSGEEFGFWAFTLDGLYGAGVANIYDLRFDAIPEPSTLTLCVLFCLSAALRRRRRAR